MQAEVLGLVRWFARFPSVAGTTSACFSIAPLPHRHLRGAFPRPSTVRCRARGYRRRLPGLPMGSRSGRFCCPLAFRLRRWAAPNLALKRTVNGMSPWPRGSFGSSSAPRPGRHAVGGRLALR
jgi:hypothetical protein